MEKANNRENIVVFGMQFPFVPGEILVTLAVWVGMTFSNAQADTGHPKSLFGASMTEWVKGIASRVAFPIEQNSQGLNGTIGGMYHPFNELLHTGFFLCQGPEELHYSEKVIERIKSSVKQFGDPKKPMANSLLIEPKDLQKELYRPGLRILDTRPRSDFAKSHVPGAVPVEVKDWLDLSKREGGFHDKKAWSKKVGQLGISHNSKVVVYGSNLTDTARIWWTLKYLGLQEVAILNGSWLEWERGKHPTDKSAPKVEAVIFEPKFQPERLEEISSLKRSVKVEDVTVVDARSFEEFTGKEIRGKRGGHIPGAKHLEWKELLAKDGRFKSPEQLRELFRNRGITPDQITVTC